MKQLTDADLELMMNPDFVPDDKAIKRQVRSELKLRELIPAEPQPTPKHVVLDLHQKTEEEAWVAINTMLRSGARTATVITGASGILKVKFQDWANDSVISPLIQSCRLVNNGSYEIRIKKTSQDL